MILENLETAGVPHESKEARIAVTFIDRLGDEAMKVFSVQRHPDPP